MPRKYDLEWPEEFDDLNIELKCFRHDHKEADGGLGKAGHFWRIVELLWGPRNKRKHFVIHPWAIKMIAEACRHQYLGVAGAGNIGKSDCFALWAIVNWMCDPVNTMVIVTSTTMGAARKRIWGSIVDYFNAVPDMPGKLVDSMGIIRTVVPGERKLSDKSGISLVAGEAAHEKESMDKLDGCHNKRVIMVADELPKLSPALVKFATGNLSKNQFFQFIGIGNPASKYDPHGILCTPKVGWGAITDKDYEWETLLGYAIRFDAELSPNITEGMVIYDFLPKLEDILKSKYQNGEDSIVHYSQCRGFWPPEGSDPDCIYSEADLVEGNVTEKEVEWQGMPTVVSACDPARSAGGDAFEAGFGLFGMTKSGTKKLLVTETMTLHESKNDPAPYLFQIARQYVKLLREHGVAPENIAYDCTGPAGEFGQVLAEMLGTNAMHAVDFNGRASDMPHGVDSKPCSELYADKVSELWIAGKDFVKGGQIKGLTIEIIEDMLARRETSKKQGQTGTKRAVESKRVMRKRIKRSPDSGDFLFLLCDLCRHRFKWRSEVALVQNRKSVANWRDLLTQAVKSDTTNLPMNLEEFGSESEFSPSVKGWTPEPEVDNDFGMSQW